MSTELKEIQLQMNSLRDRLDTLGDHLTSVRTVLFNQQKALERLEKAKAEEEEKPQACPSCGCSSEVVNLVGGLHYQVKCQNSWCGMRGHKGNQRGDAISWWNGLQLRTR